MKVDDFLISEDRTIVEALELLDKTAHNCIFVADTNGALIGSVSDGDIRRFILATGDVEGVVADAAHRNPIRLPARERMQAHEVISQAKVSALPIVDDRGRVIDIIFRDLTELHRRSRLDAPLPVVMFAGGRGTRLLPFTAILPKPLIPINDKTISERIIERFQESGCVDFHLILNYKGGMIKAYFEDLDPDYNVHFVFEKEFLGTGGGIKLLEKHLDSTFVVTNCDILVDADLSELQQIHRDNGNTITVIASLKNFTIPYGTIKISSQGRIEGMAEKPTHSALVNTGCYMVEPTIFNFVEKGESVSFPEIMSRCLEAGLNVGVYPISEGAWLDMGQLDEFERMTDALAD